MTGVRELTFRQGDRSEYLAQYLLSGVGLCVPVPRQEDIGLDFYCSIADEEKGVSTFGHPFTVQIKSASKPDFELGGCSRKQDKKGKTQTRWRKHEIEWAFSQRIPFFMGVLSKTDESLEVFSTSAIRLVTEKLKGKLPTKIILRPRVAGDSSRHVTYAKQRAHPNAGPGHGDGDTHTVDLGPPIVCLTSSLLNRDSSVVKAKARLRKCIDLERDNITHEVLSIPYFTWLRNEQSGNLKHAWMHYEHQSMTEVDFMIDRLGSSLIALARGLREAKRIDDAEKMKGVLSLIPKMKIPKVLRDDLKELLEDSV